MESLIKWVYVTIFMFMLVFVITLLQYYTPEKNNTGSVVKLVATGGHGSGVHIGNGYVITAAHVATEGATLSWLADSGEKGSTALVWRNTNYDVALLRVSNWEGLGVANLECRIPNVGEDITLKGNPLSLEHITIWGRVAGKATDKGPWASVIPVDGTIAGGMSGGGVFDMSGDLVGISVGGMIQQVGFGGGPAGIGLVVPGETICSTMAKM